MTREEALTILKEGGAFVTLAEAIGIVASEPGSSVQDLMLGLRYEGFVAEQAALALYKRTGRALPDDRSLLATSPREWTDWLNQSYGQPTIVTVRRPNGGHPRPLRSGEHSPAREQLFERLNIPLEEKLTPREQCELVLDVAAKCLEKGFTREERLTFVLYYGEELTFDEIAIVLRLSEARVRQIHQEVLTRLRGVFGIDAVPWAAAG